MEERDWLRAQIAATTAPRRPSARCLSPGTASLSGLRPDSDPVELPRRDRSPVVQCAFSPLDVSLLLTRVVSEYVSRVNNPDSKSVVPVQRTRMFRCDKAQRVLNRRTPRLSKIRESASRLPPEGKSGLRGLLLLVMLLFRSRNFTGLFGGLFGGLWLSQDDRFH